MSKPLGRPCCVADCEKPVKKDGGFDMCGMHYQRFRRRGTTDEPEPWVRSRRVGPENHLWAGDAATYSAVHLRLRRERGPASKRSCVDCHLPAAHWSYDNAAPNERTDPVLGRYTTDLTHYQPRCVPCHKHFDTAARALLTGARP